MEEQPKQEEVPNSQPEQSPPQLADVAESASTAFGLNFPRFCAHVDRLSSKSLRRMIKALIGTPLEDLRPNLKNQQEKDAFALGHHCFEAKFALILNSLLTQQDALVKIDKESELQSQASETSSDANLGESK